MQCIKLITITVPPHQRFDTGGNKIEMAHDLYKAAVASCPKGSSLGSWHYYYYY